jgi:hypothetical protein
MILNTAHRLGWTKMEYISCTLQTHWLGKTQVVCFLCSKNWPLWEKQRECISYAVKKTTLTHTHTRICAWKCMHQIQARSNMGNMVIKDAIVSTVTRLQTEWSMVWFQTWARDFHFCLHQNFQASAGANPASYSVATEAVSLGWGGSSQCMK